MKRIIAITLSLILVFLTTVVSANAQTKLVDMSFKSIDEKLETLDPETTLELGLFFNYPDQPDFKLIAGDYDENDLESTHQHREAVLQAKRDYFIKKNQESLDSISKELEAETLFVSRISPRAVIRVKVKDVEALSAFEFIGTMVDISDTVAGKPSSEHVFDNQYEDKFAKLMERYGRVGSMLVDGYYYYRELDYHFNSEGDLDWVFFEGYPNFVSQWTVVMEIDGRVLTGSRSGEFFFGFGVYDAIEDKFYDIYDIRDNPEQFEGLTDLLSKYRIGRLIGDVDQDNCISVLDATGIQKSLAGLGEIKDDQIIGFDPKLQDHHLSFFSDYDRDGTTTILDATHIQKHLASLE